MLPIIQPLWPASAGSADSQGYSHKPGWYRLFRAGTALLGALLIVVIWIDAPALAQTPETDFEQYSVRVSGFWLLSSPTVTVQAAGPNGYLDFNHDFAFNQYSTFLGKVDWKFTRKNHLYFSSGLFNQSNQVVLNRTITFRSQTYSAGATARGELQANSYAPGYQYDILRRRRGYLGVGAQLLIMHTTGTIRSSAQVTATGVHQAASSSSASLLAPLPAASLDFRLYLLKQRLYVNGTGAGMYFFGYGNYFSTTDYVGVAVSKFLSINGGYAIGSRFRANNASDRVGVNLTQKGPIAGIQISF